MAISTVARNARGSLILYEQASIDVPAAGGAQGMRAHLISQNIAPDMPLEDTKVITTTRNPQIPYVGGMGVKGGFSVQADPVGLGFYLKWLLGAPTTYQAVASVTVGGGGTGYSNGGAATFSAPQMPGGVTATGTLVVSGGAITAITITNPGKGYSSPPTVTGAAGTGATLTAVLSTTKYQHRFTVNSTSTLLALTAERYFADITQAFRATGVKFNKFNFDVSRGQCLELPFEILGLNETRNVAVLDAAPFEPPKVKFLAGNITMTEAGVAFALCKKFAASFDNQMQGLDVIGNGNQFYDIIEGIGVPTGTFTMWLKDGAIFDKSIANPLPTESSLSLSFLGEDNVSAVTFTWPEVMFMAFAPEIQGQSGAIPVDVAFKAYSDNDTSATSMYVVLENGQASYATIPS